MGGNFSKTEDIIWIKKKVQPALRFRTVEEAGPKAIKAELSRLRTVTPKGTKADVFDFFGDLIIAYNACEKSIEDVGKSESARTEAELLRATVEEILERIARHEKEDQQWRAANHWARYELHGAAVQPITEAMRRHIRRLRTLSLKDIDPILNDPSSIGKPWSRHTAETKAQRIDQILRQAYDGFIEAFGELRTVREEAIIAFKKNSA